MGTTRIQLSITWEKGRPEKARTRGEDVTNVLMPKYAKYSLIDQNS